MALPIPGVGLDAELVPFAIIAVSMVAITIFVLLAVLPRTREPPLITQFILAFSVIAGGSVLLLALLFVFLDTNGTTAWTWVLLAFNFMMMVPAGLWFIALVLFQDRRVARDSWAWPLVIGFAVTGTEVLMGILFAVGDAGGPLSLTVSFARGLSSVWFFWSMAAVMAGLVAWAPLTALERYGSEALVAAAALAPWVLAFPLLGGAAAAVLMSVAFLAIARELLRRRAAPVELRFLLGLNALFLGMALAAIGLIGDHGAPPSAIAFGAVMAVGMAGEVWYLVRRCYRGPAEGPWSTQDPRAAALLRPGAAGPRAEGPTPERVAPAR